MHTDRIELGQLISSGNETTVINDLTGESRSNDRSQTSIDKLEERLTIESRSEAVPETVILQEVTPWEAFRLQTIRLGHSRQEDFLRETNRREDIRRQADYQHYRLIALLIGVFIGVLTFIINATAKIMDMIRN